MFRKHVGLLFSLILFAALAGIVPASAQSQINLQISWWGSQTRHDRTIKVIQMYMAAHPDINITWEYANFNDYWVKLDTQASGGQLPCVMQQDYAYVQDWATRGLLMPLDPFLKDG